MGHSEAAMAKRRTPQDTLKEAVERTMQAGQVTRDRAAAAVEDIAHGAERVRDALEASRPATHEDLKALREELHAMERRLAKLEQKKPAPKRK
jgi:polyhydroxyalkanoate synthesis regulator phasin